ncbi:MAG: hypothetical protein U1E53_10140 [Dongiaceae bacterium]
MPSSASASSSLCCRTSSSPKAARGGGIAGIDRHRGGASVSPSGSRPSAVEIGEIDRGRHEARIEPQRAAVGGLGRGRLAALRMEGAEMAMLTSRSAEAMSAAISSPQARSSRRAAAATASP